MDPKNDLLVLEELKKSKINFILFEILRNSIVMHSSRIAGSSFDWG